MVFFQASYSQWTTKDLFQPVCYKMFSKVNELAEEFFINMYKHVHMCMYACMHAGKKNK